jgi:hypothetical protein
MMTFEAQAMVTQWETTVVSVVKTCAPTLGSTAGGE